eukprot:1161688-Pelagomonas_calceolata.AAC.5
MLELSAHRFVRVQKAIQDNALYILNDMPITFVANSELEGHLLINLEERNTVHSKPGRVHYKKVTHPLKGRAPPHRPRGRASTEVYSSKLAPTMGLTTRRSGMPCPARSRPTPKP